MSNHKQPVPALPAVKSRRASSGFSLIELMIAMAIFMIVGGAAVSLVRRHEVLFTSSQNQAGVNIALRNSVAQIQTDVVNAGSGYYPGSSMPFWPVGITATGTAGDDAPCKASGVWVPACFDTLTVLTADPAVPAGQPSANPDGTGTFNVGATTLYLTFTINQTPALTAPQLTTLLNQWAPKYAPNTEILLVQGGTDKPKILPLVIGAAGATVTANNTLAVQVSNAATDNLGIMDTGDASLFNNLSFGPTAADPTPRDYVIRLDATKYSVNALNQLVRLAPGSATPDPIANNIVGFQVQEFAIDPLTAAPAWVKLAIPTADWSTVRAVQVRLVARTPTKNDAGIGFQNSYDNGSYPVQGISVVINPRNLSMNN
jgi:prepilin-type N-terminal cleavage/methylation domain-containing protein